MLRIEPSSLPFGFNTVPLGLPAETAVRLPAGAIPYTAIPPDMLSDPGLLDETGVFLPGLIAISSASS